MLALLRHRGTGWVLPYSTWPYVFMSSTPVPLEGGWPSSHFAPAVWLDFSLQLWQLNVNLFSVCCEAQTNTASVVFCTCKSSHVYQQRFDWSFPQGEFRKMWSQNLETENSAWKLNCRVVLLDLKGEFRDKWSMNIMVILQNTFINWSTEYIQVWNITMGHLKVGGLFF